MNKYTLVFITCLAIGLSSCSSTYNVQGSSSISALDGSKLYLKAIRDNEMKSIDSCDVVHGQFHFSGRLDTITMANLFMGNESIMPMVLEDGEIEVRLDNANQSVGGTPLNDLLYEFIDKHKQLENEMAELSHRQSQMLLDGIDEKSIAETLNQEALRIAKEEDDLVTGFIVDNFDNILGPGVFMMMTSAYRYPVLTPQIEFIMSKASDKFKNNAYVKDFYQTAKENEARMQGLDTQDIETDPTLTSEAEEGPTAEE